MLKKLKEKVYKANLELKKKNLIILTWGNVSERDPNTNYIIIKPSGVDYNQMKPEDMVVVDIEGNVIEGNLKPSSDTPTHLEIYKKYSKINGIAHTHSINATSFAQAGLDIIPFGTTHADYFYGSIPCTRALTKDEVLCDYEINTGKVITEEIEKRNIDPIKIPGILVKNHGPFVFGKDSFDSVENALILETIAEMNIKTIMLNNNPYLEQYILDKHYNRKHGLNAYYGQKGNNKNS